MFSSARLDCTRERVIERAAAVKARCGRVSWGLGGGPARDPPARRQSGMVSWPAGRETVSQPGAPRPGRV